MTIADTTDALKEAPTTKAATPYPVAPRTTIPRIFKTTDLILSVSGEVVHALAASSNSCLTSEGPSTRPRAGSEANIISPSIERFNYRFIRDPIGGGVGTDPTITTLPDVLAPLCGSADVGGSDGGGKEDSFVFLFSFTLIIIPISLKKL